MDPITASLNLATEALKAFNGIWAAMSDAQRGKFIDQWLEDRERFQRFFDPAEWRKLLQPKD